MRSALRKQLPALVFLALAICLVLLIAARSSSDEPPVLGLDGQGALVDLEDLTSAAEAPGRVGLPISGRVLDVTEQAPPEEDEAFTSPLEPAATVPPALLEVRGSPETWSEEYEDVEWRDILLESDRITAYIEPLTREDLTQRWERNDFTVFGQGGVMMSGSDPDRVFLPGLEWKIIMDDGEIRRYRVPEEQYPDLYALARKGVWLRKAAAIKRRGFDTPLSRIK